MQCAKLKTYMETGRVVFLPARSIRPNPAQPRHVFEPEALEELSECVSGQQSAEDAVMQKEVIACLNRFLISLSEDERTVFLSRYWYVNSLEEIAGKTGFSVGKIKSMLHRTRGKLSRQLDKEELR